MLLDFEDTITERVFWKVTYVEEKVQFFFEDLMMHCEDSEVPIHQADWTFENTEETVQEIVLDFIKSLNAATFSFEPSGTAVEKIRKD